MTKVAKSGRPDEVKAYFVEEKMVAMPLAVIMLAGLTFLPIAQGADINRGFVEIWTSSALPLIIALSLAFFAVSVFAALILLDKRENTFCVPFERAASILAGIVAAYILAIGFGQRWPTEAELAGSALLVVAVALLALAPRWRARRQALKEVGTPAE